jgi:hypothetical protein
LCGWQADMKIWQILGTCLLVALATARIAKAKGRSPWIWGALGFTLFGIVFHTIVGILVFLVFA